MEQTGNSNHKSIRVDVEVRTGITIRETIKINTDQITGHAAEIGDNIDMAEVGPDMSKIIGKAILEETLGIMVDITVEENIQAAIELTAMIDAGTGLEKGHF